MLVVQASPYVVMKINAATFFEKYCIYQTDVVSGGRFSGRVFEEVKVDVILGLVEQSPLVRRITFLPAYREMGEGRGESKLCNTR